MLAISVVNSLILLISGLDASSQFVLLLNNCQPVSLYGTFSYVFTFIILFQMSASSELGIPVSNAELLLSTFCRSI